jgi:hypothetical protein
MDGPYVIELLQSPAQGDIVVIEDVTAKDKGI